MTAKELLTYLQGQDKALTLSEVKVLVKCGDHTYRPAGGEIITVEKAGRGYFEYFDDANMSGGGKKVPALVIE